MRPKYQNWLTVAQLRKLFRYYPSGCLIRKVKTHSTSFVGQKLWGGPSRKGPSAYLTIGVGKRRLSIHIVIFAVVHGRFPKSLIDHKDKNRLNNKIGNLREATYSQNRLNSKLCFSNKSGYRGIHWYPRLQNWAVVLAVNGKRHYIGNYDKLSDAAKAQREFVRKNHKQFRAI